MSRLEFAAIGLSVASLAVGKFLYRVGRGSLAGLAWLTHLFLFLPSGFFLLALWFYPNEIAPVFLALLLILYGLVEWAYHFAPRDGRSSAGGRDSH